MFRWLILLATLAVWLACMALIYQKFRPRDHSGTTPGANQAINQLFEDNAEPDCAWRIHINVERLNQRMESASPKDLPAADGVLPQVWDGVDESGLREVGWLYTSLTRKFTRAEQITDAAISMPSDLKSEILRAFQNMTLHVRADISQDQGIERFKAKCLISSLLDLEVVTFGVRNEEIGGMTITKQIWQGGKQLHNSVDSLPGAGKIMFGGLELFPFQSNPDISVGATWDMALLDVTSNIGTGSDGAPVTHAKCVGKKRVIYNGSPLWVLEARTDDGRAWAWYSAEGKALKQVFAFGPFDVMLVRVETGQGGNPFIAPKPKSVRRRPAY
jgi:hypothetical protein